MLIIGGVVASLAVFNGLYPAITRSGTAITSATAAVSDRIESRIEIIQVANNDTTVQAWVKNVGSSDIPSIERMDIFFGPTSNFSRLTYGGQTPTYWDYQLEGSQSDWTQTVTLRITIHLSSPLTTGNYLLKVVIPNGISDQITFGVE